MRVRPRFVEIPVKVEGVVPVSLKRGKIRRVRLRHLNRAKDVVAHGEVVVPCRTPRIDVGAALHIAVQSGVYLHHPGITVRLGGSVVDKTRINSIRICGVQAHSVPQELDVFEIISRLIVPLVLHPVDNALAAWVSEREFIGVVVETVPQFPCVNVHSGEISVLAVQSRPRRFAQFTRTRGEKYEVESVSGRTGIVQIPGRANDRQIVAARDDGGVVRHAVKRTGNELVVITQHLQRGIGRADHVAFSAWRGHLVPCSVDYAQHVAVIRRSNSGETTAELLPCASAPDVFSAVILCDVPGCCCNALFVYRNRIRRTSVCQHSRSHADPRGCAFCLLRFCRRVRGHAPCNRIYCHIFAPYQPLTATAWTFAVPTSAACATARIWRIPAPPML